MASRDAVIRTVRSTLVVTGVLLTVYVTYSVLIVLTVNDALAEAGLEPLRSGRWVAQTSLGAIFSAFAVFLAARAAYTRGVLTLAGFMLAQGFATGYLNSLALTNVDASTWYVARALVNWMAYAMALRTTQLFPRSLDPTRMPGQLGGWVRILVGPRRVWLVTAALLGASLIAQSDLAFQLGQLLVLAAAVATMAANYRDGSADERRKIYWLLLGGGCLFVARIVLVTGRLAIDVGGSFLGSEGPELRIAYGILRTTAWTAANLGLLSCLLMAVFYEGAIDPRLVVRRTAVYSFAVGLVVFAFAMFENYVVDIASNLLGIREGLLEAAAGAALALLFKPLHDGLTRVLERILPATDPSTGSSVGAVPAVDG